MMLRGYQKRSPDYLLVMSPDSGGESRLT